MAKENDWLAHFGREAEELLQNGEVVSLDFSGPTYHLEIIDPKLKDPVYPFIQFDDANRVKDGFCTCESNNGGCRHLAASYLKIWAVIRNLFIYASNTPSTMRSADFMPANWDTILLNFQRKNPSNIRPATASSLR